MFKKSLMDLFKEENYDFAMDGFILTYLASLESNPLADIGIDSTNALILDTDYVLEFSGSKRLSLTSQYYNQLSTFTMETFIQNLANIIITKFKNKWEKLYLTLMNDLNPLDNVSITEHKEINSKIESSSNANTFGFNTTSDDGVPESIIKGETEGKKDDNYYDLSRNGRDGIRSLKDLTLDEIEILKNNLYNLIFKDIDSVVCMNIFK